MLKYQWEFLNIYYTWRLKHLIVIRVSPERTLKVFRWEGSRRLNPQNHPMKHACNQQGHSSNASFQPNSSITGKLDLQGPPSWLCTDQRTGTERSISSMLTLTGLRSSNTIHDKLSLHGSWTGFNTFSLFSLFFLCSCSKTKGITSAAVRWWLKCQWL